MMVFLHTFMSGSVQQGYRRCTDTERPSDD